MADTITEPRWNRINGTFGEDANLNATMINALVEGRLQYVITDSWEGRRGQLDQRHDRRVRQAPPSRSPPAAALGPSLPRP